MERYLLIIQQGNWGLEIYLWCSVSVYEDSLVAFCSFCHFSLILLVFIAQSGYSKLKLTLNLLANHNILMAIHRDLMMLDDVIQFYFQFFLHQKTFCFSIPGLIYWQKSFDILINRQTERQTEREGAYPCSHKLTHPYHGCLNAWGFQTYMNGYTDQTGCLNNRLSI